MWFIAFSVVLSVVQCIPVDPVVSYAGYQQIRLTIVKDDHVKLVQQFADENGDKVRLIDDIRTKDHTDLLIHKDVHQDFKQLANSINLKADIVVDDLQKLMDDEKQGPGYESQKAFTVGQDPNSFALDQYHRHSEMNAYLKALNLKYPSITSLFTVGYSYEGRQMLGIKISGGAPNKKAYWIDAGIHAREWIAPSSALLIVTQLVTKYSSDPSIAALVNALDFYILPSANPDGLEYCWTNDRLWRKTRSVPNSCSFLSSCCKGVDPNRNWPFHFGEAGTSNNTCSNIYRGPAPFSEPETKALSQFLLNLAANNNLAAYISLHSAAQLWLVPYGYAINAFPSDYQNLFAAAVAAEIAERRVHNVKYVVENSAGLYPASGASDDWAKGVANATYVYTIELRNSRGNFVLPASQIIPTGEEVFEGIKSIANRIIKSN